jgi:hypothetical protein
MGDWQPGRYVLRPTCRRLLVAWLARYDAAVAQGRVEADPELDHPDLRAEAYWYPEDEEIHEDAHDEDYLEDEQVKVIRLILLVSDRSTGFYGDTKVHRVIADLEKNRLIAWVPSAD